MRWRIEETIRFIKESYQEEHVRMMTCERLHSMAGVVLAVFFLVAISSGQHVGLEILAHHVVREAKRISGITDFRHHALADGIKFILTRIEKGVWQP